MSLIHFSDCMTRSKQVVEQAISLTEPIARLALVLDGSHWVALVRLRKNRSAWRVQVTWRRKAGGIAYAKLFTGGWCDTRQWLQLAQGRCDAA